MISSIAREIEKWIAEHQGDRPKSIRVAQAVADACDDEAQGLYFVKDVRYAGSKMKILGIPVLVDPTLTIGKIDPMTTLEKLVQALRKAAGSGADGDFAARVAVEALRTPGVENIDRIFNVMLDRILREEV